jgi:hypothetical protein
MKLLRFFQRKRQKPDWQPIPHSIIKDENLQSVLHEQGIAVRPFLDKAQLEELKVLYQAEHQITEQEGGMFYSVYSQDFDYRQRIHQAIQAILQPTMDQWFTDYRAALNSFIIKASGPKSEFYLHQDTTGLDETQYSALSLWIPLEDVDETNGAMCVIPKSHHWFSPYRGISFPPPYQDIADTVRTYLKPVPVKAGEAVIFDNRILHNSLPNTSGRNRVVVMSGLFPKEAKIMTCFKDPAAQESKIELIEHDDDFLLRYPNFLINCHIRPNVGRSLGFVADEYPPISAAQFEQLCAEQGIKRQAVLPKQAAVDCHLIGEPISD